MKRLFWLVICLGAVVSCTSSTSTGPTRSPLDGTMDGGGGNGLDRKVYESYIVDPETLPAYKTYIAPLMDSFQQEGQQLSFKNFLKHKTWYVAPIRFEAISKDTLGVTFSQDESQQIAVQTAKEIWINRDIYNAMSSKDQADLLIHEFVMTLYFMKYKSFSEFCRLAVVDGYSEICQQFEDFNEMYPHQEPKPLDETDYQNIRQVTGYIINNLETLNWENLRQILIDNHFDKRFFSDFSEHRDQEQIEIPAQDLPTLFQQLELVNKSPDQCSYLGLGISNLCRIDASKTVVYVEKNKMNMPATKILLSDDSGSVFETAVGSIGSLFASKIYDILAGKYVYVIPLTVMPLNAPQVGNPFRNITLLAEKNENDSSLRLQGLLSLQGVVTRVNETTPGSWSCGYDRSKPRVKSEDAVIVTYQKEHEVFLKQLAKRLPLMSPCW